MCLAAPRGGRRSKTGKSCAAEKSKADARKPSASRKVSGSWRLSSPVPASPDVQELDNEASPAETLGPTGPEDGGPSPESPGGSGPKPGEPLGPIEPTPGEEPTPPVEPSAPFRFFSSTSFWNEPLPVDAPVDPSSAAVMGAFDELIAEEEEPGGGGPWINTTEYSVPIYTVPHDQPTVAVRLLTRYPYLPLSTAWSAVPLPSDAQPSVGTDGELVVWQPSTDRLWEFWRLVHEAGGWSASWGGAIQNVSSNPGVYGPEAWPEASPLWGASASSLSLVGGLVSLEDLEKGQINHALSMSIPNVRAGVYASPAQRSDGKSSDPLSLPEGAHLRLDPSLDLAALHLPKVTLMIAEAAQRYGIFVRDHARVVSFQAQDPTLTGTNPYASPSGYFEGEYPRELLASFPWSHLELLKMELHADG